MLKAFLVKILRVMFDFGFYYIVISPVIFCYIRKYVFIYAPYAVIDGNLIVHSVNNTVYNSYRFGSCNIHFRAESIIFIANYIGE